MSAQLLHQLSVSLFLVLGDSIGAGAGATRPELSYARLLSDNNTERWPAAAGQDLTTCFGHKIEMLNLARSGATTSATLAQLRSHLSQRPGPQTSGHTVVTITTGGNNLKNSFLAAATAGASARKSDIVATALKATLADLKELVTVLRDPKHFPGGVSIYLANVYDPSDGKDWVSSPYGQFRVPGLALALARWNAAFSTFAQANGVTIIDAHSQFHKHGYKAPTSQADLGSSTGTWFSDPIHPNDQGHHALRLLFYQAIASGRGRMMVDAASSQSK